MAVAYYSDTSFRSNQLALDIALKNYFSTNLFKSDSTRVIYASNAYCYRERADRLRKNAGEPGRAVPNGLDFPFANLWQTQEPGESSHLWKEATALRQGLWIDELATKVMMAPVTHSYQATAHYSTMSDLDYAYSVMSWASEFPIELPLALTWQKAGDPTTPVDVDLFALLKFSIEFNPEFNEQEWLNKEKIVTMTMDFTVETMRLKLADPDAGAFWVPDTVIFDYASKNSLDVTGYASTLTRVLDHVHGTIADA